MFENPMNPLQNARILDDHCCENLYAHQYNTALNQFKAALLRGTFFRLQSKLLRRRSFLYDLNTVKSAIVPHGSCYAGLKVVCIRSIIGSEGKTSDFDMGFYPIHESARERWVNMAIAHISRISLPPVALIDIAGAYFIRDGHHRVSVARAFGQVAIDAEVITWNAAPPFPWQPGETAEQLVSMQNLNLSA